MQQQELTKRSVWNQNRNTRNIVKELKIFRTRHQIIDFEHKSQRHCGFDDG